MRIAAIGFTERGCALACRLRDVLAGNGHDVDVSGPARFADGLGISAYDSFEDWTREAFDRADALLFVSATGIAVRAIAPYVKDKFSDPAVVSIDEAGRFAIPLLSGHVGGANDFAREVATACGAQAAISTATDVNGLFAVDEWARKQNLAILDRTAARDVAATLLAKQPVGLASDYPLSGKPPFGLVTCNEDGRAQGLPPASPPLSVGICISLDADKQPFATTLRLVPRVVTVGVGCKRNTPAAHIAELVDACLEEARISPAAVAAVASIDVKADEEGLRQFAKARDWEARFFSADELAAVPGEFTASAFVAKTVGVDNVCERAACAAAGIGSTLLQPRRSQDGVTVAVAAAAPALAFE